MHQQNARLNPTLIVRMFFITGLAFAFSGCEKEVESYQPSITTESRTHNEPVYVFSIHPLHNPTRLHDVFGPVMEYLSKHIDNAEFQIEASRNYASYDKKLYARKSHFSLPNPFQTINALKHGYRVFGKMGDDENFRGIILVRKDSKINEVSDLKGKAVSYPAPTALAATMLPQYYLKTHGLDVMNDVENRYVGSQESSVLSVYLGNVAAGATWPPPWHALIKEQPELAEALEIKWQTQSLPNNGLIVRDDIPDELVKQVSKLLFELHTHDEGRKILERIELSKFEAASDITYQPVVAFIDTFSKTVRKVN
ncbi:MAG: phosphate/phosphite/phosphonate ABC transporter substrate-binding protein [Gammaproteobacteria bacterium]|nr:phosphate/phosphite/phosphonate ABC transporter substrate-binding protein [Gammaproteobacteria bacterium]